MKMLPQEWSEDERTLAQEVFDAFGHEEHPGSDVAADLSILHDGELQGVMGYHWTELFEHRRIHVHDSDWVFLTDVGVRHYLPAYVLSLLDEDSNVDALNLALFLSRNGLRIMSNVNEAQRVALCSVLMYMLSRAELALGLNDEVEVDASVREDAFTFKKFVASFCHGQGGGEENRCE